MLKTSQSDLLSLLLVILNVNPVLVKPVNVTNVVKTDILLHIVHVLMDIMKMLILSVDLVVTCVKLVPLKPPVLKNVLETE
jgi:hypothetical protein